MGTILASVRGFTLSLGAAKLGPTLSKPKVKKGIDGRSRDHDVWLLNSVLANGLIE